MVPLETKTLLFRVRGGIKLAGGLRGADARTIKLTFVNAIKDLIPKVNSQAFSLTSLGSSLIIWPKTHTSTHPIEMQDETECGEILKFVRAEFNQQLEAIFKQRSTKVETQKVVNLHFMFELGSRQDAGNLFIVHDKKSIIYYNMILPIDVVVFAQPEKPWGILQDQFLELITSQLSEMEQCIQKYADGKTIPIPQPFHFDLPEKATLVTVVYPGGVPEEILEPERRNLHRKHGLDNKPYFHRTMAYYFPSDDGSSLYIRNIHKYISLPDTKSFKGIYLVHGYYTYHHILEDHHNDVEWGTPFHCIKCVINWFRIQGYISKPLPSVGDLQKILLYPPHEIIVESIEWIGSTEIMGLLASFGISASTMVVQNTPGNFLDQGKIVKHFIKHGSPVIISSFHQSYVLLGVAMSDVLENSRYLIMDPDITGIYEMAKIIEKAIEWKGGEFWERLGPYNIFLPVRPEGI